MNKILYSILFISIVALNLFSCTNDENANIIPKYVPDSTAYFDSCYLQLKHNIDTFFLNRLNATVFNGNILFAERGRVLIKNYYGYAKFHPKDTLTIDNSFQLASVSKTITAVAVMQLVEKGLLGLNDSVQKYIEGFPYHGITIEMLLSHCSGLSEYTHFCDNVDTIWPNKDCTITNNNVIAIMDSIKPAYEFVAGSKFYYSNTNFMLLASVMEKVTGKTFVSYVKKNIFLPSGMKNTVIYYRDNKEELIAPCGGYNGAFNPCIDIYLNGCVGDKGVYTTVTDLFRFDVALQNGKLLSDSTLILMWIPHGELPNDSTNYGYGWRIKILKEGQRVIYHTGWWKGFRSYYIKIPESDRTIIILNNVKRGPFFRIEELVSLFDLNQ